MNNAHKPANSNLANSLSYNTVGDGFVLLRCPALSLPLKRLRRSLTAATRSGRFTCHWQRSLRSPSRYDCLRQL